jgi:LCP family protein required for cell wall assembly
MVSAPGTSGWGPELTGGRRRVAMRALITAAFVALAAVTALGTTGLLLVQKAEASLTRVPLAQLDEVTEQSNARHFLVVGSDSREGLTPEQRRELVLGEFEGQQADTIIYVSVSQDRRGVSLVSLPRDLMVYDEGGRRMKLGEAYRAGPDGLIGAIRDNFGLPVHHYTSISLGAFINVVQTLGGVEMVLPAPLRDERSGADFEAGPQRLDPQQALAYIRSRSGARADFERIDRQQRFLRAVLSELVHTRVLSDPRRLFQLVDDVASEVTTDDRLTVGEMYSLADELRWVVREGVPMTTVPGYTRRVDGIDYVIAYRPGAEAMFEDLRAGLPLAERGTPEQRRETPVAVWWGHHVVAADVVVVPTLIYAGFEAGGAGSGPVETAATERTRVFVVDGYADEAGWVGATLGVTPEPLPEGVVAPLGARVVVSVGPDASS